MASIPATGQVAYSALRTYSGFTSETSLDRMEVRFMTGTTTPGPGNSLAGICMTSQAQRSGNTQYYSGSQQAWRPTAMSEFRRAQGVPGSQGQGKPQITSASTGATGNVTTCTVTVNFVVGEQSSYPVFVRISSQAYTQMNSGTSKTWNESAANSPWTAYIKDNYGCGADDTLTLTNIVYP